MPVLMMPSELRNPVTNFISSLVQCQKARFLDQVSSKSGLMLELRNSVV